MEYTILALLAVHFVADFLVQSALPGNVAIRKSSSWSALLLHTSTYSLLFLIGWGWKFALVTFVCHTVTDAITSRLTTRWWYMPVESFTEDQIAWREWPAISKTWTHFTRLDLEKRSLFWNTIGLDQWLHAAQLILTAQWLLK